MDAPLLNLMPELFRSVEWVWALWLLGLVANAFTWGEAGHAATGIGPLITRQAALLTAAVEHVIAVAVGLARDSAGISRGRRSAAGHEHQRTPAPSEPPHGPVRWYSIHSTWNE